MLKNDYKNAYEMIIKMIIKMLSSILMLKSSVTNSRKGCGVTRHE